MAKLELTHPLFQLIRKEHKIAKLLIERAIENPQHTQLQQQLEVIFHFVEQHHHKLEEETLFLSATKSARIREGGPFCAYYFDSHITNNPLGRVAELLIVNVQEIEISELQKHFYGQNAPVTIPVDEHRAGNFLLKSTLDLVKKSAKIQQDCILRNLNWYRKIQESHISKEESCFFHLCLQTINCERADDIFDHWNLVSQQLILQLGDDSIA